MKNTPSILQLKIKLQGSRKPPIWRQVLVPDDIDFQQLHAIIQGVMGWDNSHLHQFTDGSGNVNIGIPFDDDFSEIQDGRTVKINQYLSKKGDALLYEYDFGDDWEHLIEVQKVMAKEAGQKYPQLVQGKGACPPEDCGGIWGYYLLVEAINDPAHESHEDMIEWMGVETWNVHEFDLPAAQQRLARSFANASRYYG